MASSDGTTMSFYELQRPPSDSEEFRRAGIVVLKGEQFNVGDAPMCPSCGRPLGMLEWLPPFQIELETWGEHYADIAMTTGSELILSERLVILLQQHKMLGLEKIEPVEVVKLVHRRRMSKGPVPSYFKATVVRSSTTVDQKLSGMQWAPRNTPPAIIASQQWKYLKPDCPVCLSREGVFVRQKGIEIQSKTWTGEDIFYARGGGSNCIVSGWLKEVCEQNEILGAAFIPVSACELDFYPSASKILLKAFRVFMDKDKDRESRVNAYRTLAFVAKKSIGFEGEFDPDLHVDLEVLESISTRLSQEGLLPE